MTIAADPSEHGATDPGERKGNKPLAIGVLIVAILAIVIGGWLTWTRVFAGPAESGELDIGAVPDRFRPRAFIGARQPPAPVQQDGIHPGGANLYRVQSGEFSMVLAPTETSYAPVRLNVRPRQVMNAEEVLLVRFCNATANAGTAKSLDVTPDQEKQLAAIRPRVNGTMKISDADHNTLRDLWKNWNAAKDPGAKNAAQTALLNAMKEIGNRSMGPTRQEYSDAAAQIRKIATPKQLVNYRQMR